MSLTHIGGLPAHVLLVHVLVVIVPVTAAFAVASAWSPEARRRLGVITPLFGLAAFVLTPITTHAGRWLQARVGPTPLVARHVHLGNQLLPWTIALFVVSVGVWLLHRRDVVVAR